MWSPIWGLLRLVFSNPCLVKYDEVVDVFLLLSFPHQSHHLNYLKPEKQWFPFRGRRTTSLASFTAPAKEPPGCFRHQTSWANIGEKLGLMGSVHGGQPLTSPPLLSRGLYWDVRYINLAMFMDIDGYLRIKLIYIYIYVCVCVSVYVCVCMCITFIMDIS